MNSWMNSDIAEAVVNRATKNAHCSLENRVGRTTDATDIKMHKFDWKLEPVLEKKKRLFPKRNSSVI